MLSSTAELLADTIVSTEPEPRGKIKTKALKDLLLVALLAVLVLIVSGRHDLLEKAMDFAARHEEWELDEFFVLTVFLAFALAWYSLRRAREITAARDRLAKRSDALAKALDEVRQLKAILPICSSCKRIRDDDGYWHNVELYIRDHTGTDFTHGICPECTKKLYPDLPEGLEDDDSVEIPSRPDRDK